MAFVSTYRHIRRTFKPDYQWGRFRIAALLVVLFYNIAEAAFLKMHLVWFMFLLIALGDRTTPFLRAASVRSRFTGHPPRGNPLHK
jgi:hypothetical protein